LLEPKISLRYQLHDPTFEFSGKGLRICLLPVDVTTAFVNKIKSCGDKVRSAVRFKKGECRLVKDFRAGADE
jgi:hypothetical protein